MPAHRLEVLFLISTMPLLPAQLGDDITHQIGTAPLWLSCRRGWKQGKDIYEVIRSGAIWIGEAEEREGKTPRKHVSM